MRFGMAAGCIINIDFAHHTRLYLGLYEKELEPHFKRFLREGYRSFDIGGQGGYDALLIARATGGEVISFECDPAAVDDMRATFARNPFPISAVQAFVGETNDADNVTIDAAALRYFVPDFIKMDIEGAETAALLGAQHVLSTRKPSLIVEVHDTLGEQQCLDILRGHGYAPQVVDQRSRFADHRPTAHNRWLACSGDP